MTPNQLKRLHAELNTIAESVSFRGSPLSVDAWRRLLLASFLRESGYFVLTAPALDGDGFDIIEASVKRLSPEQASDFIEYVAAFASENQNCEL